MRETLGDLLVVCDMDGTLLRSDNTIAPADMDTIRLFRMLGGHFTVASGRTIDSVAMYPELAAVIDPAITSGGCVIYDFAKKQVAKSLTVPPQVARTALFEILDTFPDIGCMVMGSDTRLYRLATSEKLEALMDIERMTWFTRPEEDLPAQWNKVVFAGPEEMVVAIGDYAAGRHYPGVYFQRTNLYYMEMMPEKASKGNALHDLSALLGVTMRNTYVIGDYYNDLDMMRQGGYAVAVRNAPEEVRAAADEITGSNDEGGVGQFLYKLIQRHGTA